MSEKLWREVSLYDLVASDVAYDTIFSDAIVSKVREKGIVDPEAILSVSLGVTARLIFAGLVEIGDVDDGFTPWPGTPAEVFERVAREWMSLGRIDDGFHCTFWVNATKKGQEYGDQVRERLGPWLDDAPDPPSPSR